MLQFAPVTSTPPNSPKDADRPLLTVADVRALKADHDADVRLLAELPARIEEKRKRLDAAMMFLPPGVSLSPEEAPAVPTMAVEAPPAQAADEEDEAGGRLTWIGELERVARESGRGLSYQEALQEVKKVPELAARSSVGDKGFYRGLTKLADRGIIIKNGGMLLHRDVAAALKARGEPLPSGITVRISGGAVLVMKALEAHPEGLTGAQVKKAVSKMEGAPASVKEHPQYVYTILGKLTKNGLLTNRNGVYQVKRPERSDS